MTFGGGVTTIPLLVRLKQVFDADDATHIAQAKLSDCDYFMTLDDATILARRSSIPSDLQAMLSPLKIVSPEELMSALGLAIP